VKAALSILLALATPAAADTVANVIEKARLEVQPAARPFTKITIDNALGDVVVEGYDGTAIQIETKKQAPDDEALERLRISLVPNPDGTVRITTTADRDRENKPLVRSAVRIDLKVRAPRSARIEATANSGALTVSNMDAGGDLDTASGPIKVNNVSGELSTHTVSGATSLTTVWGSIDSQTLSADLDLDSIGGEKLIASANRGKIAGRRVRSRHIELTSGEGKITLEAEATLNGRVIVSSIKGDVDVRVRRKNNTIAIRAKAANVNLGMAAPAPVNGWVETRSGSSNANAALIEMRSRYGNVQFTIVE
jgi:DUF4097 and DUF4098 domain-containing protein YvlB